MVCVVVGDGLLLLVSESLPRRLTVIELFGFVSNLLVNDAWHC
jgi:hypothetical protein